MLARLAAATCLLVATTASAQDATSIAVLDVRAGGGVTPASVEGLSALIATEVARVSGARVISGGDLRALVGLEKQKELLGCGDTSCLAEIGGALGVTYLVASEVAAVGDTWLLTLSLVHVPRSLPVGRVTRRASGVRDLPDEAEGAVRELLVMLPRTSREADSPWPAVALGTVAVGAGAGAALFLLDAAAQSRDLDDGIADRTLTRAQAESLRDDAISSRTIGWGLAGAAVAAGVGALLLWPDPEPAALAVSPGVNGVVLSGRWP